LNALTDMVNSHMVLQPELKKNITPSVVVKKVWCRVCFSICYVLLCDLLVYGKSVCYETKL